MTFDYDKKDLYDDAIHFLNENPSQIQSIWDDPKSHPSGILFLAASPSGTSQKDIAGLHACGDICEIISRQAVAYTREMTVMIWSQNEEDTLPGIDEETGLAPVTVDMLERFAEWQRLFDITWERDVESILEDWGYSPKDLKSFIKEKSNVV